MKNHSIKTMNRRDFLTTAGTAAIGMSALHAFAVNEGSKLSPKKIKIGLVGIGGRGGLIADMLMDRKDYHISALCDYFEEVVESKSKKYDVPKNRCFSGLTGYQKLLDTDVEAVILETPPCFFPEHVAASVAAGKHVYFAKPVACDVPGTLSILESGKLARKQGQVFLIDFQVPTNSFNQEVVKHVQEGMIGQVSEITSYYCDQGMPDPALTDTIESRLNNLTWVNDINLGGGVLVNAGIHSIDSALWVANSRPIWAMGASRQGRKHYGDTHDVYSITYMLENGIIVTHRGEHMDNMHDWTCRNKVWGEHGYAELGYMGRAWVRSKNGNYRGGKVSNLYPEGITYNLSKFANCIQTRNYENDTLESGVESNLAVILGKEACHRQTRITREQLLAENKALPFDTTGLKA